ncbi:MAG TPA: translocation/assembly module TamB domain-containing protein, partial [Terriglobales bacterium]|nr:translocation/assembly module TamB domain-containing protein [Terriglobales bacterium]
VSFTPDFDMMSFVTQFGGVASPPATTGTFEDNLKLNLAVRSTSELNVVSPTVSLQGDANLRVIGTAADPVIVGRTNLTGGDVIVLGNRYTVQGGTIAFVNTVETQPIVNLQVNTNIQQYNIAMRFRGPFDRLQTNYTSDPALSQADIIHLIAFGSTEEAANAAPSQSTTLGAESLIASQVSSQVTGRLEKALGVSQISLDPQLGATSGNQQQGARLTVRQRVTSKLFVTFSTDVTTTQFSAIQLQYQVNKKWSVSGVRDENGGFGLDGRYHKDF